jgi:hypothetical protein
MCVVSTNFSFRCYARFPLRRSCRSSGFSFSVCFIFILFILSASSGSLVAESRDADSSLARWLLAVENGGLSQSDLRECKRLTKSKDNAIRVRALALYAQILGENQGDLAAALSLLLPELLSARQAAPLLKELSKSGAKKKDDGLSAVIAAIPPAAAAAWDTAVCPELCIAL